MANSADDAMSGLRDLACIDLRSEVGVGSGGIDVRWQEKRAHADGLFPLFGIGRDVSLGVCILDQELLLVEIFVDVGLAAALTHEMRVD